MNFRIKFILLLIISIMSNQEGFAEELPIEAYSALPSMSLVTISPEGDRFAYRAVVNDADVMLVRDIKSGEMIGGFKLGDINPYDAYFASQDKLILHASTFKRIHRYRGRHYITTAYVYDLNTKNIEQLLVQGRDIRIGQRRLGDIAGFSPDMKYVYMPALIGDGKSFVPLNLMRVELDDPKRINVHKRGGEDTRKYFVDSEGNVIARERYNNKTNKHSIQALVDDDWKEIFTEQAEIRTKRFLGVTPDFKSLVMIAGLDGDRNAYYTLSLNDGSVSNPLFYREDASIGGVIKDKQQVVYGVYYRGFKPQYAFFDEKLTKSIQDIQNKVPNNTVRIVDHTPDWNRLILYIEGDQTSGDYYLSDNGQLSFLASSRPDVPSKSVAPIRAYAFAARDGLTIPVLVTYPLQHLQNLKNLPAIMMPHGGPQSHDKIGFDWLAQYFANRGYVVLQPQFRGSSGFGYEFTKKGHGEWGKKMQDDLTDAVVYFADQGLIDKNQVCIVGWSYGGYAALAGAAFAPDLYRCAISINGVSDVERMMVDERRDYGEDHWVVSYWDKIIRNEELDDDHLDAISPINYAKDIIAPILLIHGEDDTVVPTSQSESMADELEDEEKVFKFIKIEDEGHSIDNSNNGRHQVLKAIDTFLAKHLMN